MEDSIKTPVMHIFHIAAVIMACPASSSADIFYWLQFNGKTMEGNLRYTETDELEKNVKLTNLVTAGEIAFSEWTSQLGFAQTCLPCVQYNSNNVSILFLCI
jgi:hypothetical protein